jgi:hypothetical protein
MFSDDGPRNRRWVAVPHATIAGHYPAVGQRRTRIIIMCLGLLGMPGLMHRGSVSRMNTEIPYSVWHPLSVADVMHLFANVPFRWGLAGGYAVEQFLGMAIRAHSDIDIVIFRDDQLHLQRWLSAWQLYAADPAGMLRLWTQDEYLPAPIHDIWGHERDTAAWQLQIMLADVAGDDWVSRSSPQIRGARDMLLVTYNGIPCVRVEVQLLYKARGNRPKDRADFAACLPRLSLAAKQWLKDGLHVLYPDGHPWFAALT